MTLSMVERYDTPGTVSDAELEALRARIAADGPRLPLAEPVLDEAAAKAAARKAVADMVDERAMDAVLAQIKGDGLRLTGPGGFLSELVKAVLERGLAAEMSEHLGYGKHDPAGKGSGNSRNGAPPKTVQTEVGPIEVRVPRDRAGTFTPRLLPKNARRLGGLSDVIISLYAGGIVLSCRSCSGLDEVGLIHRFVLVKLDCGGRAGARVRSHRSSEARPQLPVEDLGGCRVLWRVVASGRRSRSIGAPPRAGLGLWRSRPSGRSVRRRRDGGRRAIEVREARLGEVSTLVNLGQLLGRLSCQPPHEGRLICFTRVSANSRAPSPAPSTMPVATGKRNPRRAASARRTLP